MKDSNRARLRDLLVIAVLGVNLYAVYTSAWPTIQWVMIPGESEWGAVPEWILPTNFFACLVVVISAVGIVRRSKAFVWPFLIVVCIYAVSELGGYVHYLRDLFQFRDWEQEPVSPYTVWYSTYGLRWAALVVASFYVLLGVVGKQYFRSEKSIRDGAPSG
jgi:hypothetical protein